ncbi:MAG: bifunctional pyr operon transcriptional regulator/uracil phosphoribosyltransferase PyrR [Clostridia bacterium]|nr:bifunctional pyr operon transcriptional regulator/uracil phosphoribosyltransferase PyrR [Clostridia bacterium]
MDSNVLMNQQDMSKAIARLSYSVAEKLPTDNVVILGIHTGGATLAQRIASFLKQNKGIDLPVGVLDITAFRDDVKKEDGYQDKTKIDFDVQGKNLVLVDDVLYTGRTVRAALNAINELGRPKTICLTVLVDRGHRELPIKPDFVGKNVPTNSSQKVDVKFCETDGYDAVEVF